MKGLLVKAFPCSQHNVDAEQPEEGGDKYGGYLPHRPIRRKQRQNFLRPKRASPPY